MEKITSRWYVGLVIIPIFINYITSNFSLTSINNNFFGIWNNTIILTLIIVVIILSIELSKSSKKNKILLANPKPSDKKIVLEMLETLDYENFQVKFSEHNSWYGYSQNDIRSLTAFVGMADMQHKRTTDDKLNRLINDLKLSIHIFTEYSSRKLFSDGNDYYVLQKDTDSQYNSAQEASERMNKMTDDSFEKLKKLLDYLKQNNYFD